MIKYKSYVNTQSILLLLFVTLSAIIIGVSYHKMKHIENFKNNNTSMLHIDYYYTPTCSTCKKFEQNHLKILQSNDYLEPYIMTGKIKLSTYNVVQRRERKKFMEINENKTKRVPALFIYDFGKKPVKYTGELSYESIYRYIQKNHPNSLQNDDIIIPIEPTPIIKPPIEYLPTPIIEPPTKPPIQYPPTKPKPPTKPPIEYPPDISLPIPQPINPIDSIYKCKIDSQDKVLSNYFNNQENMKEKLFNLVKKIDDETMKLKSELKRINNVCERTK